MRLSGWCSPDCGPRAHATCQDRIDRGLLAGCGCPKHVENPQPGKAKRAAETVDFGVQSGPGSAVTDRGLATVSTRPKGA